MTNKVENSTTYSEPSYLKSQDDAQNDLKRKLHRQDVSEMITPETKALLKDYSNIPIDEQPAHVERVVSILQPIHITVLGSALATHLHGPHHKIKLTQPKQRSKAWSLRPYPCIGLGVYLVPQLQRLPIYPEILQRLSQGQILADVGCFIGHDLRHLVKAGAPAKSLYGFDIVNFWDLGFEMFQDHGRFDDAHFVQADIMAVDDDEIEGEGEGKGELAEFKGKIDIISIAQVLHQWDWPGQVSACRKLTSLSKPGSLIVGNQIGNVTAQAIVLGSIPQPMWRHNEESFAQLWEEVGLATGTTWESKSWLRTFGEMDWRDEDHAWMEEGVRVLEFVVRRVT